MSEKELINNDFTFDSEGGQYFLGEHFDLETARRLYKEEYDEKVIGVRHCYAHYGIIWPNDEKEHGYDTYESFDRHHLSHHPRNIICKI